MSDIFSTFDLVLLALIGGSPGLVIGAAVGAWRWRRHRIAGLVLGGIACFALCLGGVLVWLLWIN
ncbi:MAG: hypothetical protein JJ913_12430 [Rhizobiaceae bacterium]|nr:hypothetical protein [Rhizobiaceae bacterium]